MVVYERVYGVCVGMCTERVVRFRSNDSSSNGEVGRSQVGLERQPLRLCYVCVLCSCGWGGFRAGGLEAWVRGMDRRQGQCV